MVIDRSLGPPDEATATLRVVAVGNTLGLSCRGLLESVGAGRGDEVEVTVKKARRRNDNMRLCPDGTRKNRRWRTAGADRRGHGVNLRVRSQMRLGFPASRRAMDGGQVLKAKAREHIRDSYRNPFNTAA